MNPIPHGDEKVNILLVDDRADKLLALETILSPLHQTTFKAQSGDDALRLLLQHEFAVVLLDINMPGLDGFETASLIRQRESTKDVPIIFVSALEPSDERIRRAYALRAVDYVPAPAVHEALLSKVSVFVELQTKHKRLQEVTRALQEKNKQLESFCYTIAHDLRAPLRCLQNFSSVLVDGYGEALEEQAKDFLNRIRNSASRMDRLIQDLLAYNRQNYIELNRETVDLAEVINGTLKYLETEIHRTGATVQVREASWRVRGHKESLTHILINLVSNAIKFVADGRKPEIEIYSIARENNVRVAVRDNGIGIEPQYSDKVFELFERLPSHRLADGNGVGLAIVKTAVERMGGKVGVDSTPGNGATFWFELPTANTSPRLSVPSP